MDTLKDIVVGTVWGLCIGLLNDDYEDGVKQGHVDVASGKVVCQQALGEWICKPKDEEK